MSEWSAKPATKRVLIVDDHPMTRDGLTQLINSEPDLTVTWQAENAEEAIRIASSERPDLALVDITLPDKAGIELIRDLKALHPELAILVISMHDESLYAERALRAGARGYITKQEGGNKLMHAIRQVLQGEIHVSEKMLVHIVEVFSSQHRPVPERSPVALLSDREFEVFHLLGQGLATQEIGERMGISTKTVEAHRVHVKSKLGLHTSAELIAFAARWLTSDPSGGEVR